MTRLVRLSLTSISTCAVQCGAVRCRVLDVDVCVHVFKVENESLPSLRSLMRTESRSNVHISFLVSLLFNRRTKRSQVEHLFSSSLSLSACCAMLLSLFSLSASNKCDTSKIEARLAFSSRYEGHLFPETTVCCVFSPCIFLRRVSRFLPCACVCLNE